MWLFNHKYCTSLITRNLAQSLILITIACGVAWVTCGCRTGSYGDSENNILLTNTLVMPKVIYEQK